MKFHEGIVKGNEAVNIAILTSVAVRRHCAFIPT